MFILGAATPPDPGRPRTSRRQLGRSRFANGVGLQVHRSEKQRQLQALYYENTVGAAIWVTAQPWMIGGLHNYMVNEFFPNSQLGNAAPCVVYSLGGWPSFDWGAGAPCASTPGAFPQTAFPADNWSSRHIGVGWADVAGPCTIRITSDDGVRLYVDNVLLIDQWFDGFWILEVQPNLAQGWHALRVEHYERTGNAVFQMTSCLRR